MEYYAEPETWNRDDIRRAQTVRLKNTVEQALRTPFYREYYGRAGIDAGSIADCDDIVRLPFTDKDQLREAGPDRFLAVPKSELVRLHASSGTTGPPAIICHTQDDLDTWADLMARCLYMVGIRKTDVFQNIAGYGLFTGGLGIHSGAERLGCLTIPAGTGNTRRQLMLIRVMGVTALHIIPSYALYLGNSLMDAGEDPRSLPPRIALIGAEPHTEEVRQRIEYLLGLKAYNSYGLSEMNGPGVAFECMAQNGLHVWEDAYLVEILDPQSGQPVPEGECGELVLTTLIRRGMPLIRYRTRDLTRFLPGDCPCGRAHRRIDRIHGRVDDMFIIKGCNIYPLQVEKILMSFPEVGETYLIVLEQVNSMDQMRVQVEIRSEYFVEDMRELKALQNRIASRLRDEVLVTPKVELVQQNSIPRTDGKAKRVDDRRRIVP
jgi:phenylacetate-CoA ligase